MKKEFFVGKGMEGGETGKEFQYSEVLAALDQMREGQEDLTERERAEIEVIEQVTGKRIRQRIRELL